MGWALERYWHRVGTRRTFATSLRRPEAVYLHTHQEVAITRPVKVTGNRGPYDGDWVYWSIRQGRHPNGSPRLAKLLKAQGGSGLGVELHGPAGRLASFAPLHMAAAHGELLHHFPVLHAVLNTEAQQLAAPQARPMPHEEQHFVPLYIHPTKRLCHECHFLI
jgi:hypothetical protein